jgi:molybdopterin/thiamine biosynthesis adenylyltransferase
MLNHTVNIIGLGGIGSAAATPIARVGCKRLILFDDDIVEDHNLENQDYDIQHIGRPKVKATEMRLYGIIQWHEAHGRQMKIIVREERVTSETRLSGIVVVCVDTPEARKEIFTACRFNPAISLYIEAGAAENRGMVRAFNPHDKDQVRLYEMILDAYGEGGPAPCVSPYMSGQFASVIALWVYRFGEGWRPKAFQETSIDYLEAGPTVSTTDVYAPPVVTG